MNAMRGGFVAAFIFCAARVCADGVTDFIIHPAAGYTITEPGNYRLAADGRG